ncbi:MAG: hypothetical protein ACI9W2_003392, partial [Gammaproteobacteria bacterium]
SGVAVLSLVASFEVINRNLSKARTANLVKKVVNGTVDRGHHKQNDAALGPAAFGVSFIAIVLGERTSGTNRRFFAGGKDVMFPLKHQCLRRAEMTMRNALLIWCKAHQHVHLSTSFIHAQQAIVEPFEPPKWGPINLSIIKAKIWSRAHFPFPSSS